MKNILIKAGLLLAALLLQYTLVQKLKIFSFTANLCVTAFIGICFFSKASESVVMGAVYGLLIDGAVGRSFGVNILLYIYLAAAVKAFANEKHNNSPALLALDTFGFSILFYLAYGLLSFAVPRGSVTVGRWLITAVVTSMINAIAALAFYALADIYKRGGERA